MKTTVHRDGDRVWLEGVEGWFVGQKESSVHAAQEAIMKAVGEDVPYAYLLGVSGLAFRMQVSRKGLCPSSPHSFCGYECHQRSFQSLPWQGKVYGLFEAPPEKAAEARAAVVESIDRGVPVQYGSEEDGLIVGYQKGGEEWLCLHYFHDAGMKETFVETKLPWGLVVFTGPKEQPPDRETLAVEALRQAVEMAQTPVVDEGGGGYAVGFAGWEELIGRLEFLATADEKTVAGDQHGNAWIYESLVQYRRAAGWYLREIAPRFAPPVDGHLRKAARLYARMADEVLTDPEHCILTVAPYPGDAERGPWTVEKRQEELRRLEAALPLEREAISEIEKALAAMPD